MRVRLARAWTFFVSLVLTGEILIAQRPAPPASSSGVDQTRFAQIDMDWNGTPRKLMLWANRNGFFYVLDRTNGKFVRGAPFVKQNWAAGLDESGRPIRVKNTGSEPGGTLTYPNAQGGTNFFSPSYSPRTGLFYVGAWNDAYAIAQSYPVEFVEGRGYTGGSPSTKMPNIRRPPINYWTEQAGHGEIQAIDPRTGEKKWVLVQHDVTDSGILTTDGDMKITPLLPRL